MIPRLITFETGRGLVYSPDMHAAEPTKGIGIIEHMKAHPDEWFTRKSLVAMTGKCPRTVWDWIMAWRLAGVLEVRKCNDKLPGRGRRGFEFRWKQ